MLDKKRFIEHMTILGDLTEEQKAVLTEALEKPIADKELIKKLDVDEARFAEFMRVVAADQEEAVLQQELSPDEMAAIAGGMAGAKDGADCDYPQSISCYSWEQRYIYTGSFPNCAATVEDGSFCDTNDACYTAAVWYLGKKDCAKAWK